MTIPTTDAPLLTEEIPPVVVVEPQRTTSVIVTAAVLGLAACFVTIYFFCPRYYLWRSVELDIPELLVSPEVNRAVDVLKQLDDPSVEINNPSNRVIVWRPLFPRLGNVLTLHRYAFLSLTLIGCWAAAAFFYVVLHRELRNRYEAFCGTLLACGCAWFFVSTSWLSYNDSWIVLGLSGVAFARSRWSLIACCLLSPWIEERFLITLPVALALRSMIGSEVVSWRTTIVDVLLAATATSPYIVVRLIAYYRGTDPIAAAYLTENFAKTYPLSRYFYGAWAGLRCNWIYIGLWTWLAWSYRPRWWVATTQLGIIATFVTLLAIAGDLHRSASAFVPLSVAGIILFHRRYPTLNAKLLPALAAINLVLPASHVITAFDYPIYGLFDEINNKKFNSNQLLNPQYFNDVAVKMALGNQIDAAMIQFDRALKIDPEFQTARLNKALILSTQKRYDEALAELHVGMAAKPDWPEALYIRGVCREAKLDYRGAVADYEKALAAPDKTWGFRAETERLYKRLRGVGITPRTEDKSKDAKTESKK